MGNRFLSLILVVPLLLSINSRGMAAYKLRLGTALKVGVYYNLVVMAGEEKGFWKQNGLEVEWIPFRHGCGPGR